MSLEKTHWIIFLSFSVTFVVIFGRKHNKINQYEEWCDAARKYNDSVILEDIEGDWKIVYMWRILPFSKCIPIKIDKLSDQKIKAQLILRLGRKYHIPEESYNNTIQMTVGDTSLTEGPVKELALMQINKTAPYFFGYSFAELEPNRPSIERSMNESDEVQPMRNFIKTFYDAKYLLISDCSVDVAFLSVDAVVKPTMDEINNITKPMQSTAWNNGMLGCNIVAKKNPAPRDQI